MASPLDARRCPLCGEPNVCGMAEGATTCWCTETKIPKEVLDRVPADAVDRACVCQACASGKRSSKKPLPLTDTLAKSG